MKIEEVRISAPWGHIAAKIWGNQVNEIVVLVHGLMDNAGSFDNLIPFLPKNLCYVCIDLPGHGRSSHLHRSIPLHTIDYTITLKIVFDHFKREKYMLLGHSLGGEISILFSMVYPDRVSKLVSIDALAFHAVYPSCYAYNLIHQHKVILDDAGRKAKLPKSYSYDECVEKLVQSRKHGCFDRKSAENLAERMIEKTSEGRYIFGFDKNLRAFLNPCSTHEYITEMYERTPIKCPFMVILNSGFDISLFMIKFYKYLKRKGTPIHVVNGHHDSHMTNPEGMGHFICNFLSVSRNKL